MLRFRSQTGNERFPTLTSIAALPNFSSAKLSEERWTLSEGVKRRCLARFRSWSLLVEESRFSRGIEILVVESLKSELEIIRIFMMDVNARSVEEELSHEVKIWLKQAKKVAEMVEDFVDKYVLKVSRYQGLGAAPSVS